MLHSPFPTILAWGPEMVFLYNDAAISTLTVKHPSALGGLYRDVFHEAWELVGADLEACFCRGETAVRDNMFIPILLNGVLEDHYWSYSLIPVYENGKIGGVYDAFRNMTETVVGAQKTPRKRSAAQAGDRGCAAGGLCLGDRGRPGKPGKTIVSMRYSAGPGKKDLSAEPIFCGISSIRIS